MPPFFGVVIVFAKTEFGRFKKPHFKLWLKSALAIFILALCFEGVQAGIMNVLRQYVFSVFDLIDPYWGIGTVLAGIASLFVLAVCFIYMVALLAHCIEYPYKDQKDGSMARLDYINTTAGTDIIDDIQERD